MALVAFAGLVAGINPWRPHGPDIPSPESMIPVITPRIPQISGTSDLLQSSLTYGFKGPQNSSSGGLPIPVIGGRIRVGGQIINYYIESSDRQETLYLLLAVSRTIAGAIPYGATADNIWINETKKLSGVRHAEYIGKTGLYTQEAIPWFNSLHQVRDLDIDLSQPIKELLHFEESPMTDASIFSRSLTTFSVTRDSTAKVGTYSGLFAVAETTNAHFIELTDGSSDENCAWDLGTQDFTFETWLYSSVAWNGSCAYNILKWEDESDGSGYHLWMKKSGATSIRFGFNDSTGFGFRQICFGNTTVFSTGVWYHLALVRAGNSFHIFKDGSDITDTNISAYWSESIHCPIAVIGTFPKLGGSLSTILGAVFFKDWKGRMDEFRFSKCAQYVSTFTPTTVPFSSAVSEDIISRSSVIDKMSLTFDFPYGLYSMAKNSSVSTATELVVAKKSVDLNVYIRQSSWSTMAFPWPHDAYKWMNTAQTITADRQGLYRKQMDFEFNTMHHTTDTDGFLAGEEIVGQTSSASAIVPLAFSSISILNNISGTFVVGETVIGQTSTHEKVVTVAPYQDAGQWSAKVLRTTEDDYNNADMSQCQISMVNEVLRKSLAYPGTALLGIKVPFSDKIGSSMENVSVVVERGNVTYPWWAASGGGTHTDNSNNPANMFMEIMCNHLGVNVEKINQASINAWSSYCETAIGTEVRAHFNGIFDTFGTGEDAIMVLLKVGRASLLKTNEYKIAIETVVTEANFTGLFTAGNITSDTFQQQWMTKAERPHAITVEYQDASDEYARKSYTHRGSEYDTTTEPLRIDRDFLLGCTNTDEAKRYAILRYQLKTMINASCSFEATIDAVNCEPGDCIWVQPLRSRKTFGGRVRSSGFMSITLDQSIVLDAATYDGFASVWVRHTDGTIERRNIGSGFDAAPTDLWAVTVDWTAPPVAGDVYGIGRYIADLNTIDIWRWRVMGMSRSGENRIRLECIEYNPKVYCHADYGAGATII